MKLSINIKNDYIKKDAVLGYSMLHYRGVAFPRFNDMIFRRRLLCRNWEPRKRTLLDIRDKLTSHFNDLYDFTNASLRRDMLFLFCNAEELRNRLLFESKNLPLNQDPYLTDNYSLILQLRKVQIKNPKIKSDDKLMTTTSDIIEEKIREQFEVLENSTIEVDSSWLKFEIRDLDNDSRIGFQFLAPNEENAKSFLEEVSDCIEQGSESNKYHSITHALRVFDFLDIDPKLNEDKYLTEEKDIVQSIFKLYSDNSDNNQELSILKRIKIEELKNEINPSEQIKEDIFSESSEKIENE